MELLGEDAVEAYDEAIELDKDNNPFVLEVNPLPSLSREDVFMTIAEYLGISFEEMVIRLLKQAIHRYGL